MLSRIIDTVRKDGAVMFPAADDRSLRFVSSMLSSRRFAPIPIHYASLLKFTNGMSWNGIELYGTEAIDRKEMGYVLPSLIDANVAYDNYEFLKGQIILGRAAEELFVYDSRQKKYFIIDRVDFTPSASFPTFSEAIYLFVDDLF
jgi:hypothetical protein